MATITAANVATNDTILATDHNKVVTDLNSLNSEIGTATTAAGAWGGPGGFRVWEDCLGEIISGSMARGSDWSAFTAGAGAAVNKASTNESATAPGIWRLETGTATNGKAYLYLGSESYPELILGGGTWVLEARLWIGNLASGGEDYDIRFGLMDLATGDPTNGVFIEYDRGTRTNWSICAKGAGTTRTDSAVAVAAGAWVKLRMEINAAGNSTTFYVNGTSCGTVSTNHPTAALFPCLHIVKSAGTTARYVDVDYLDVQNVLTASR